MSGDGDDRCTRELLERLKAQGGRESRRPTNRLGDWYAKLVSTKRGRLAICVNERSFLPALVAETTDSGAFVYAFREAVRSVLQGIGAESQWIRREARETEQIALGAIASRRILGSLNDLAFLARAGVTGLFRLVGNLAPDFYPESINSSASSPRIAIFRVRELIEYETGVRYHEAHVWYPAQA